MTTIEQQWQILEAESDGDSWRLFLARPSKGYPMHVALDGRTRRRALLLRASAGAVPPRHQWPRCRGLLVFSEDVNGQPCCGVVLQELRFADVFTALAEDLARRVADTNTAKEAVGALFGQLARWQKFLMAGTEGLSEEAQRGLWGELHCLIESLLPAFTPAPGAAMVVLAWKGGERAPQDFQFPQGALEVKTTTAKQPQTVRITNERQLDNTSWPNLILHVLFLEMHDGNGGTTLPEMVKGVRAILSVEEPSARDAFEDALLASGYLDVHALRYVGHGYSVRSARWFRVREGFPRLVEADLPPGVGDANYALSIAACEPFCIEPAEGVSLLKGRLPS